MVKRARARVSKPPPTLIVGEAPDEMALDLPPAPVDDEGPVDVNQEAKGCGLKLPCHLGALTVLRLGKVVPGCEVDRYIYPIGYTAERVYHSITTFNQKSTYRLEIEMSRGAPQFRCTPLEAPKMATVSSSPTGALAKLIDCVEKLKRSHGLKQVIRISGPLFFGLYHPKIGAAIQKLPRASECTVYLQQNFKDGKAERFADRGVPQLARAPRADHGYYRGGRSSSGGGGGGGGGGSRILSVGIRHKKKRVRYNDDSDLSQTDDETDDSDDDNGLELDEPRAGAAQRVRSYFDEEFPAVPPPPADNESGTARCEVVVRRNIAQKAGTWTQACVPPLHILRYGPTVYHRATVAGADLATKFHAHRKFVHDRLTFGKSAIHGWGVFARQPIAAGEIIVEYVGELIRQRMADIREKRYIRTGKDCYMFRISPDLIIDATCTGNLARLINHSCQPNCISKQISMRNHVTGESTEHIVIMTKRDIEVCEELTYDYQFPMEDLKVPCYCMAPRCRKFMN